jgi:ankyrin repeat protein
MAGIPEDPRTDFIEAALWHGPLDRAQAILAAHPDLARRDIHTAAILGDVAVVRRFLAQDAANATTRSEPYGGNALVYLCLSKYLRLDPKRAGAFVEAATALLDAGADPDSGFWSGGENPEFESALYGAAGVAHNPELTRLLLERGADPNDIEVVYHSPETHDNAVLQLLVETGRITPGNLTLMLIRKHDWHDYEGASYLLEHGADPIRERLRGLRPMHHALVRDNALRFIELLLDHGGDPSDADDRHGVSAVALAARRGRGDVLALFEHRGTTTRLEGVDALLAACARGDAAAANGIADREPETVRQLIAGGGKPLAEFGGNGNSTGVGCLLDLGVPADAAFAQGDAYWDIAPGSTALHVAAWRLQPAVVKQLIERGTPVNALDGRGRSALALAVRACVDSYWMERRSPEPVRALLEAGASTDGVLFPSGYAEVDALLEARAGISKDD